MFRVVKLAEIVATLLMLLIPAYCQQEVDPTWYDPWTVTSKATLHHLQEERKADLAHRKKIKSAAGTQQGEELNCAGGYSGYGAPSWPLAFQGFAIPISRVGGCVVSALQKFHQRCFGGRSGADVVVH